jgi:hypothetical protein
MKINIDWQRISVKIFKILSVILCIIAVGWLIPKLIIKDNSQLLNDHFVSEGLNNVLNHPLDRVLFLKAQVVSGTSKFNTPFTLYINAYTWFGIKYATIKMDCLFGNFFSSCSGVVIK